MNVGVFTALFIILVLIVIFFQLNEKEGFQDPILHIPESPVAQKNLVEASQENYAPTYILAPGAAPGAIASFNSLPYRDPSLEKANFQRILNLQTTLKGFLENEAKGLEDLSDPSIQLPLSSARGDLSKLRNEVLVLKRNPGIDSTLTQQDVDEVQANMAYLQKKWRRSIYNDLNDVEGFQDSSGADLDASNSSNLFGVGSSNSSNLFGVGSSNSSNSSNLFGVGSSNMVSNYGMSNPASNYAMSNIVSNYAMSNVASNTSNATSNNIGINDLRDLINKINVSISRLSSSGTTDPVVLARVNVLQKIKKKVENVLNEVMSGARPEADIPITKDSYNEFLKTISNVNSPVTKLFGKDSSLAGLFPAYSDGDVDGAIFAQNLFSQYSDMLFKGMSFDVNIRYASPAEQGLANSLVNAISQNLKNPNMNATSQMLSAYDINTSNNAFSQVMGTYSNGYNNNVFTDLTSKYLGNNAPVVSDPNYLGIPTRSNTTYKNNASPFDWQERSAFICDAIKKRGLNPKDFGCLRPDEYVSDDFSWRGYAKMICTRLGTSMDTGLPETCGCPPLTWSGWRP